MYNQSDDYRLLSDWSPCMTSRQLDDTQGQHQFDTQRSITRSELPHRYDQQMTTQVIDADINRQKSPSCYTYPHLVAALDNDNGEGLNRTKVTECIPSGTTGTKVVMKRRTVANGRPPYSYIALICMAISNNNNKRANLRQIIHYIEDNFVYYRSDKRWYGTLRHHLSFNDCFVKLGRRSGERLCQWTVNPDYRDMFDNGSLLRRRYRNKRTANNVNKQQVNNIKRS